MTIREIQDEIVRLKEARGFYLLAHSYQPRAITEIADFAGDSYALSVKAAQVPQENILMCGVRFMAETAKILSPKKHVFLSAANAGCPMAEQFNATVIRQYKAQHPEVDVVAYINTTAELKTLCDVCVTSSSAVKIIAKLENNEILFLPDCNLGAYVQSQLPQKHIHLLKGGCPVHAAMTEKDVNLAQRAHPGALLLVHPECPPEVCDAADYVGSTSGIMKFAKESAAREFIIGTEISIAEILQNECPEKRFYPLSKKLFCPNMKATTLMDVYHILNGDGAAEEILMSEEKMNQARVCIDKMIALGG